MLWIGAKSCNWYYESHCNLNILMTFSPPALLEIVIEILQWLCHLSACCWRQLARHCTLWSHVFLLLVVVVVVMTSPSGASCMGGQMSRRDEEFHQTLIVLEHVCDVSRITKERWRSAAILGRATVNVQPSRPHYHNVDRLGIQFGEWVLGRKPWSWVCWASVDGLLFVLFSKLQEVSLSWVDHDSISNTN